MLSEISSPGETYKQRRNTKVLATILKPFCLARIKRFSKFLGSSARRNITISLKTERGGGCGEEEGEEVLN